MLNFGRVLFFIGSPYEAWHQAAAAAALVPKPEEQLPQLVVVWEIRGIFWIGFVGRKNGSLWLGYRCRNLMSVFS